MFMEEDWVLTPDFKAPVLRLAPTNWNMHADARFVGIFLQPPAPTINPLPNFYVLLDRAVCSDNSALWKPHSNARLLRCFPDAAHH